MPGWTDSELPPFSRLLTGLRQRLEQIQLAMEPVIVVNPTRLRAITKGDVAEALAPSEDIGWASASSILVGRSTASIHGGVNPGDRRALYHFVRYLNPRSVLEIGTHVAASTVHLAQALLAAQEVDGESRRLTTVDVIDVNEGPEAPWRTLGLSQSPRQTLQALNLHEVVHFVQTRSDTFLRTTDERYDLVFVDGLHTAAQTYRDVALSIERLRNGGSILLHDYFPALRPLWTGSRPIVGPYLAIRRLMDETCMLGVQPIGDLPWETKFGTRTTSLAFLSRTSHGGD